MTDTDANSEHSEESNRLAYAGISLLNNRTRGSAPQWHEISAWCEGSLPEARAAEVLSHVANNAEYFQQWLDVVEARQWLEEEALHSASASLSSQQGVATASRATPAQINTGSVSGNGQRSAGTGILGTINAAIDSLRNFFKQPLPLYGGALAAIMLAVLVAPLMRQTQVADLQRQLDRSTDAYIETQAGLPGGAPIKRSTRSLEGLFTQLSQADVERQNFQFGLRKAAVAIGTNEDSTWQQWIAELPETAVDCDNAEHTEHCTKVQNDMNALGHWTLLSYAACQQQGSSVLANEFWTNQLALFDQLGTTDAIADSTLFGTLFSDMPERSTDALCNVVGQLLAQGQ